MNLKYRSFIIQIQVRNVRCFVAAPRFKSTSPDSSVTIGMPVRPASDTTMMTNELMWVKKMIYTGALFGITFSDMLALSGLTCGTDRFAQFKRTAV